MTESLVFIDDDEARRRAFEAVLAPLGHAHLHASSFAEASDIALTSNVVLVFVATSRRFDAFALVSALRDGPATKALPVVMLDDGGADDTAARAYEAGAVELLDWPLDARVVRAKMSVFIERTKQRNELFRSETLRRAEQERREEALHERNQLLSLFADVGLALGTQVETRAALAGCAEAIVRHLDAAFARIWTLSEDGLYLDLRASAGMYTHLDGPHGRVPVGSFKIGLIAAERKPHLTNDVQGDPRVGDHAWARENGMVAFAGYPMMLGERLIGVIAAFARHPLSEAALSALQTASGAVAQGIERAEGEQRVRASAAQLSATTELLKLQASALEASKNAAEAANRTKSMFLANMSHELRTPLNAVIGYSELLQEEVVDAGVPELVNDLKSIHAAGKHLLGLINDILDLSKIEAGKMELFLEDFAVDAMLDDVEGTIRPLVVQNGNRLEIEREAGLVMHADLTKVRQTLFNLLSNAAKFTKDGLIRLTVKSEHVGGDDVVRIRVSDTGIGMSGPQLERVFEPFVQADESTTRKFGGTGLGLAISRRFCSMMGGGIGVTSELGKGSVFTVTLPRTARAPRSAAAPPNFVVRAPTVRSPRSPVVLVIDDDADARELLERHLTKDGFRVVVADNGADGIALARKVRPIAITLDVLMPSTDGWAVLSELKSDPALREIPVIMVTMVSARQLGYRLGASEYLTKPFDRARLSQVLARYRDGGTDPHTALLVEDDGEARRMTRAMLEAQGWTVSEAENGAVGLERLRELRPSVVLLDLMMPTMDGFAFVESMREDEALRETPVVVVTAKDLTAEERFRLSGSVIQILQKGTTDQQTILDEVRAIVASARAEMPASRV